MLEQDKTLLIVTDIQGNLARAMTGREELYKNVSVMIEGAKALGLPILWVEQYPEGLGATVPEIAAHLEGLHPVPKRTFSSLRESAVAEAFNSHHRNQVILTGIETHVCIHQTALDLTERGIETHVPADAVSSRTSFNKEIGLAKMAREGVTITSVETALFELLKEAKGTAFKTILGLIK